MDYRIILINIFFLSHPNAGEVYDVTTIYRYGMSLDSKLGVPVINSSDITLEIHARTNAFGLPFLLHNKSYVEPNVGINIEPCTAFIEGCKWKKDSFVSTLTSSSDIPLSITGMKPTHHFWSKDNVTINLKFSRSFEVTVDTADDSGIFGIFLMDSNGDVKTSDMYYIYITNSKMGHSFLLKCDSSANTLHRLPSNYGKRKCEEMQRNKIELTRGYWKPYWYDSEGPYTFKVLYSEGHLQVTAKWSTREFELFKWQDPMPINVDFYSFGTVSYYMKVKLIIGGTAVLALTNKEGSLVSPTFVPNYDSVCISVTYYRDPNSDLILYSVWPDGGKLRFEDVQTIPMMRGWLQTQFIIKLTDENKFNEMNVLLTAKANKHSEILIQRIAGCNSEGLEDVYISSNPVDYPMSSHGFDVAVFSNTSAIGGPIRCMNGGKFSKSRNGCICPAGFTGSTCVNGCGANMYGSNCEGHCSRTKRGCYGMKLCRPELECMCAPGLKGIYCDNPCQDGEYGVDCKEKCGHCKESLCDPYTGLCPMGCEPGYHPPYCQENYHYLTAGPEATDIGFYNFRLSIYFSSEKQAGSGKSRFFQFQYKKIADYSWLEMEPRLIDSDKASLNISQLEPATTYQARVVLIDSDGNSYQGLKVAVSEVRTQCKVPANLQYNLRATKVSASGFQVSWDYIQEDPELCSLLFFEHEIKEYWGWVQYSQGKETLANFVDMLPGQLYHVRVRAFTVNGPILFSNIITVKTDDEAPSRVFDIEVLSVKSREIELKWSRPIITAGVIRGYLVIYQCQKLLACEGVDCSYSTGEVEVTSTSTVLKDLVPHAQYAIRVSALAGTWGPQTQVLALTDMSVPEISPEPNSLPVTDYTNSSFVVNWDPPKDCTKINGYMYGYHYMLLDSQSSRVSDGITQTTSAEFTNLLPYLTYTVKVFLYTSGGLSSNPLVIAARTKQPSPGPVEELTVYKRSHDLLGFRWAAPRILNGEVESFSVSYKEEGASQEAEILIIKPEPCVVWPQVYCHTFENLQPDTKYVITVQAKSTEMIEYGDPVAVTGITTESAPDAPSYIRILSQTQSNIAIEWGIPYMLNGLLRSFHVKVEETDSYNASDCCQYFPVHETIVRMEQSHYFIQYSRLRPASTYIVSVAAKTTALGPANTIRTYTRPPIPYMDMFVVNEKSGSIPQNPTVTILPSANFQDLISGYLLLVLPVSTEVTISNGMLWDKWLNREVRDVVNKRYFIAYELDSRALEGNSNIVLGTGSEEISGKWGVIHDSVLEVGKYYRLGLIVILEYQGLFSVGYTETDALKVV